MTSLYIQQLIIYKPNQIGEITINGNLTVMNYHNYFESQSNS